MTTETTTTELHLTEEQKTAVAEHRTEFQEKVKQACQDAQDAQENPSDDFVQGVRAGATATLKVIEGNGDTDLGYAVYPKTNVDDTWLYAKKDVWNEMNDGNTTKGLMPIQEGISQMFDDINS